MVAAALAAVVASGVLYAYVSNGRPEDGPVTDAWLAPLPDDEFQRGVVEPAAPGTELWATALDKGVWFGVEAGPNGTAYVTIDSATFAVTSTLLAVDRTGKPLWRHEGQHGAPAIGRDGTIYVAQRKALVALDAGGAVQWWKAVEPKVRKDARELRSKVPGAWQRIARESAKDAADLDPNGLFATFALGRDGTIYAPSNTSLFAFSHAGQARHLFTARDAEGFHHVAVADDGTVYALDPFQPAVYAVSAEGRLLWSCKVPETTPQFVVLGRDGTIYSGSDKLHAISREGKLLWSRFYGVKFEKPAFGEDGTLYCGGCEFGIASARPGRKGYGGVLCALTPDGRKTETNGHDGVGAVIGADGAIYVLGQGSNDSRQPSGLYAIGPDGVEKWSITIKGRVGGLGGGGLALAPGGLLYYATEDAKLHCVKASSGPLLARK
jgi:hypothetical protein